MKVYVLTHGDYDDFNILAIFSTKEKAEKYLETVAEATDSASIDEWDVDDFDNLPKMYRWSMYRRLDNPAVHYPEYKQIANDPKCCHPRLEYTQVVEHKGVSLQVFGNSKEEVEQLMKQALEDRNVTNS